LRSYSVLYNPKQDVTSRMFRLRFRTLPPVHGWRDEVIARNHGSSSAIIHRRLVSRLGTGPMPLNFTGNTNPAIMCDGSTRLLFLVANETTIREHVHGLTAALGMATEQTLIHGQSCNLRDSLQKDTVLRSGHHPTYKFWGRLVRRGGVLPKYVKYNTFVTFYTVLTFFSTNLGSGAHA